MKQAHEICKYPNCNCVQGIACDETGHFIVSNTQQRHHNAPGKIEKGTIVFVFCVIVIIVAILARSEAETVAAAPAGCRAPLLVVLPDGTEVGATAITYDLDTKEVIVADDRLFCDGFE